MTKPVFTDKQLNFLRTMLSSPTKTIDGRRDYPMACDLAQKGWIHGVGFGHFKLSPGVVTILEPILKGTSHLDASP